MPNENTSSEELKFEFSPRGTITARDVALFFGQLESILNLCARAAIQELSAPERPPLLEIESGFPLLQPADANSILDIEVVELSIGSLSTKIKISLSKVWNRKFAKGVAINVVGGVIVHFVTAFEPVQRHPIEKLPKTHELHGSIRAKVNEFEIAMSWDSHLQTQRDWNMTIEHPKTQRKVVVKPPHRTKGVPKSFTSPSKKLGGPDKKPRGPLMP
jgi:hypothetical protein